MYAVLKCFCVSNSLWPRGLQPTRLFCPRDLSGKNTGMVAMPSSRESFPLRAGIHVSCISLSRSHGGSPYTYTCTHRHLSLLKIFLFQELTDISYPRSSLFQTCPMLPKLSTTHLSLFYFSFKGAASTWIVTVQKYEFSVARTPNFSEKLRFQIYRWNHSFLK